MAFNLKKFLEGAIAEVNPWDGGKTYASVNKPVVKINPASTATPTLQVAKPVTSNQTLPVKQSTPSNLSMGAVDNANLKMSPTSVKPVTPTIDYNNPVTFAKEWGKEALNTAGKMATSVSDFIQAPIINRTLEAMQKDNDNLLKSGKISTQQYIDMNSEIAKKSGEFGSKLEAGKPYFAGLTTVPRNIAQGAVQSIPKAVGDVVGVVGKLGQVVSPDGGANNFFKGVSDVGSGISNTTGDIASKIFQTQADNEALKGISQSGGELLTDVATGNLAVKALGKADKAMKVIKTVGNTTAAKYAAKVFNETFDKAKAAGKTDEQAGLTAAGNAGIQFVIERLGGVSKYLTPNVKNKIISSITNALAEGGEEASQQLSDNIINLTINEPKTVEELINRVKVGVAEAGASGVVLGGLVGTASSQASIPQTTTGLVQKQSLAQQTTTNPAIQELDDTFNRLQTEIKSYQDAGYKDTSAQIKNRIKSQDMIIKEQADIENSIAQNQPKLDTKLSFADRVKKKLTGFERGSIQAGMFDPTGKLGKEVPTTMAYGNKIEMTEKNGYKPTNTADGGVIYSKVNRTGTNAKGTQLTTYYYDKNGNKLTQAQAEAMVSGVLPSSKPVAELPIVGNRLDTKTKTLIEETAANYNKPTDFRNDLIENVWNNNKKGSGVEFINNNNQFEPGFDVKRISNNSPFYREFFAENGRKPTKTEITEMVDDYLSGKNNMMKYELQPEDRIIFDNLKERESYIESLSGKVAPEELFRPLIERITPELPIVGKPIASRKAVEPKTVIDTTMPQKVKQLANQPKSSKKGQSFEAIIAENRMLPQGELPVVTPAKAKQIFKKEGRINPFEKVLNPGKKTINLPDDSRLLDTDKVRADVQSNLSKKYDDFERSIYGDTTSDIKGGTKGANWYQQEVRAMKEGYNKAIEKGLSSESNIVRNISRGIRTLFGSAGDTATRISQKGSMRGGIDESINLANDFKKLGDTMLPDKASQERVWAVLDPELAGTKIDEASLTPQETKALQAVRQASDLINDTNFAMGKISHETWLKGKDGKYLTRAYEEFDIPTELKDSQAFVAGKGKLETGGYMQRKDVDAWKQENAIKDPFYLASKRIQSTMRNKAITDYANWINKQTDMISDSPRKGYTKLSDSPMWGELSGKNIRHDVLTDIKGFYSDSKALQGAYDFLNAYDRFKPRQILKSSKTVLNPATRLGNQVSNRVFAALNGVNVAKFEWNMHKFAPQELANNGKYARLLRKEGILGTDMTKYELAKTLVKDGVEQGKISQLMDKIKSSYGAADDKAKLSAFKYWLDKGKTVDEAILKVRNGFQDYSKVGLLYDIAAKTPLVGKSFVRFQSELARIIKNSATENPLSLATVVGSIALIGTLASMASGETPEDKATREGRFGTPVIPFTQIPLVFQTPIGEINVARMFGMYETSGADTVNKNLIQRVSKYLPFDIPTSKEDVTKMLGNDVLLGGIANQITDTDFRGKSISDPDSNKYQESTLTDEEKLANRAGALYHNYQLPIINDIENVGRAAMGMKDQYGRTKTVPQALSKLTGFKVEQFGPEQAAEQRAKDAVYADYDKKDIEKQINSIIKDQAEGKIDQKTADSRIKNVQNKAGITTTTTQQSGKIFTNPNGGFSYLDDNGSLQTEKTQALAELAIAKSDFKKSDKNLEIVGDKVLRKNEAGEVQVTSKSDYDYQIGTAKLSQLKRSGDVKGWITQANKQLELLDKQIADPNTDPLDAIELLNKADALQENIDKYTEYGGFTKPKKTTSNTRLDYAKGLESIYGTQAQNQNAVRNLLRGINITRKKVS